MCIQESVFIQEEDGIRDLVRFRGLGGVYKRQGLPSLAGSGWTLAVIWIIASAAISAVVVVFQALGASIMPENRGGALSFLLSFRFVGHAVGPIVFVPLIDWSARGAFFMAAGLGLVTTAVIGTFRTS